MAALADDEAAAVREVAAAARREYASCYCEENVWAFVRLAAAAGIETFAVFISNAHKQCPVWRQRKGDPVVWDYHMVALVRAGAACCVVDFDSTLGLVTPAEAYVAAALGPGVKFPDEYRPRARVVDGATFLAEFATDRRHMRLEAGGYSAPPPARPHPRGPSATSAWNLDEFWDVCDAARANRGRVASVPNLVAWFGTGDALEGLGVS